MKYIFYYIGLIIVFISSSSCTKEEALPVNVAFSIDVFNDDYSVPVDIVIFNTTKGGDTFEWTFEGGIPATSIEKNPGIIRYAQKGNYKIKLYAKNADGSEGTKVIDVQIDDPVGIDFSAQFVKDNFTPAAVRIENNTTGATRYAWFFEGGIPETSQQQQPGIVTFETPGAHLITLEASNGLETETFTQTITVAPQLIADFEFEVAFQDDDFQIPVKVTLLNKSTSATAYEWTFTGANLATSTLENPELTFNTSGEQTLTLRATNGKETKTITKTLNLFSNTNLRSFENIKLGINTAHISNITGAFFSIQNRKVYTAEELIPELIPDIDLVFFGLNQNFVQNRFVSPNALETTTFPSLENGNTTKFINSLELCECDANLTASQFDAMKDDTLLRNIDIEITDEGLQAFDNTITPRIVLFETKAGLKGAIKIKAYVNEGNASYIEVDIKTQKENL